MVVTEYLSYLVIGQALREGLLGGRLIWAAEVTGEQAVCRPHNKIIINPKKIEAKVERKERNIGEGGGRERKVEEGRGRLGNRINMIEDRIRLNERPKNSFQRDDFILG